MAKCNINNSSPEHKMNMYNAGMKVRKSFIKQIKTANPEFKKEDIAKALDSMLEYYEVPQLFDELVPAHSLYGRKSGPIDVYDIKRTRNGYEVLYVTPSTKVAKVTKVDRLGKSESGKSTYDMDNLNGIYRKFNTNAKTNAKTIPEQKKTEEKKPVQGIMTFKSSNDTEIDFTKENAGVIDAELINDMGNAEGILNYLIEIDDAKLTKSHEALLRKTLRETTDEVKKNIPDMIQVINTNAKKTGGFMNMEGDNKGLWVNVSKGAQKAGNQMTAAEVYVHELKHASLEFAQKFHPEKLSDTMEDVLQIYNEFMNVVTEEDFMPSLENSTGNRTLERKIAKDRIAYLRMPNVGLNEFIVMSETNEIVNKVLTDKVTVNKKYEKGKNLFDGLIKLITKIYDHAHNYMRGNNNGLDGATAMTKYIQEISNLNNIATDKIREHNASYKAIASLFDALNDKGSTYIKKFINKIASDGNSEDARIFMDSYEKYINDKENGQGSSIKDIKFLSKMIGQWLATNDIAKIGAFETWMEMGPGKILSGIGFEGLKPEGDIMQLLRVIRDSDQHETNVEKIGLLTNKVEQKMEQVLNGQAELIKELFDNKLTDQDSIVLTKGVIETELDGLINENLNGSEAEQTQLAIELLNDKEKVKKEIIKTKAQLKFMMKNEKKYNFVKNQAEGLGKYMITGNAGSGQLMNSFMILGLSSLNMKMYSLINENKLDKNDSKKAFINKLITLHAIEENDSNVNERTSSIFKKDKTAVLALMKYDQMARTKEKEKENKMYDFDINYVKGKRSKISSNYMQSKVGRKNATEKNVGPNYIKEENLTYNKDFEVYINSNYTEIGWSTEGTRRTNDHSDINSYINVIKEEMSDIENAFDVKEQAKIQSKVKETLIDLGPTVFLDLESMTNENYKPSMKGMRPVFAVGQKNELFVTDMDISVDRQMLENQLKTNNKVQAVVSKTLSRAIDIHYSKETGKAMLDEIERDMNENFLDSRDYFSGGKKNLMTYVKLGPTENNKLNKEIWPGLPRYMKIDIHRRHINNIKREISSIAEDIGLTNDNIWNNKSNSIKEKLESEFNNLNSNEEEILKLSRELSTELTSSLKKLLKQEENGKKIKGMSKEEITSIRDRITNIEKSKAYIASRRNLVYHQFGRRDPELFTKDTLPRLSVITKFLKKLDMLWKELVKISKVNIVVRDLPVLAFNILSNILLAVLNGRNPIDEVMEQFRGMKNIHRYMNDMHELEKLNIKMTSGTQTTEDEIKRDMLQLKINKNPAHVLVQNGLYSSITEDLSNKELHKESFFDSKINNVRAKLPKGVQDAFNILYITKETSIFGSLLKMMQYSDFGARYSTYYMLMNKKGMTSDQAAKKVLDNQINYNFRHGKIMQWMNERGLFLFTKFVEGIQRVVKGLSIDKPFNVILAMLSQGFMFDDSPLGDSMLVKNFSHITNSPFDILGILAERPALVQILTGKF